MKAQLPSTEYTLEDLREIAYRGSYDDMQRNLARALLTALEQEPSATVFKSGDSAKVIMIGADLADGYTDLFAHPAPVPAVPDECPRSIIEDAELYDSVEDMARSMWSAMRAAMLNGGKS